MEKYLLFLAAFVLVFLSGCIGEVDLNKPGATIPYSISSQCEKLKDQLLLDTCYNDQATWEDNAEICGKIIDLNKKDDCYYNISSDVGKKGKADLSICGNVSNLEKKDSCYYQLVAWNYKLDKQVCEKIIAENLNTACYTHLAQATLNMQTCSAITDQHDEGVCYVGTLLIGVLKGKKEDSNKFMTNIPKYLHQCELMKSDEIIQGCFISMGEILDANFCTKIFDENGRDLCYYSIAAQKNNTSFCAKIINDTERDSCIEWRAFINKDNNICNEFSIPEKKEACNKTVDAIKTGKCKSCYNSICTGCP